MFSRDHCESFKGTFFQEHLRKGAFAGVLLEFWTRQTFMNKHNYIFLIVKKAVVLWLWEYKFYIEFLKVNFKKYGCPRFNCEAEFLRTSSNQSDL